MLRADSSFSLHASYHCAVKMPPVPVTRSSTSFLATATSIQQVIFYIGLGISIAIAIASIAFLTVWVRRLWTGTCSKFFYGWRNCSQGTRAINLPVASVCWLCSLHSPLAHLFIEVALHTRVCRSYTSLGPSLSEALRSCSVGF